MDFEVEPLPFPIPFDKWDLSYASHPQTSARTCDLESLSLAGDREREEIMDLVGGGGERTTWHEKAQAMEYLRTMGGRQELVGKARRRQAR